jgi:hypothetical protein
MSPPATRPSAARRAASWTWRRLTTRGEPHDAVRCCSSDGRSPGRSGRTCSAAVMVSCRVAPSSTRDQGRALSLEEGHGRGLCRERQHLRRAQLAARRRRALRSGAELRGEALRLPAGRSSARPPTEARGPRRGVAALDQLRLGRSLVVAGASHAVHRLRARAPALKAGLTAQRTSRSPDRGVRWSRQGRRRSKARSAIAPGGRGSDRDVLAPEPRLGSRRNGTC